MEIIIPHELTDFDGLASMIAATKIYPVAKPVFPGYLSTQVKDFMALFKDQFHVLRPQDVEHGEVTRVILVDTKDPSRVGPFKELLFDDRIEKIVYDHHLLDKQGFAFTYEDHTAAVGSTTTLLIQRIQHEGVPITPMEATLFALGIYHDTGCLTYSTTTPLDAEMVAFLLERGARLTVVEQFVDMALNEAQQEALNVLINHVEHLTISGLRVDLYCAALKEYLLGVNNIIHKIKDIREADLYFIIVQMQNRVMVVGRSDIESMDLARLFQELGGGGHPGAASAVMKNAMLDEVKNRVLQLLYERINLPRLAKDIMTSPVKTVPPDASIQQVDEIMQRYGHSGLVVVQDGKIQGIFSRRDLDKVKKSALLDLPVKGYMTRKIITVTPLTPIGEVQRLMVAHDIGRLPVVDETGALLGLITRTDLLKTLYGEALSLRPNYYGGSLVKVEPKRYNVLNRLTQSKPALFDLFCRIRDLSDELGMKPHIVGGFVRDLLRNKPNHDLDFVIEGDGIRFAEELHKILGGKLEVHPEFQTATLEVKGFFLDVATARVEYYEYPAALPHVEPGLLKQDLYRRDFTINALAISLEKEQFGWLVDFFGGKEDLENGIIRGLHSFTFIDDPTRILRGLRFAVRFGFSIEEETDRLIRQAVIHGVFQELKGPRLWEELKPLLVLGKELQVFQYFESYGVLANIISGLKLSEVQWAQLKQIEHVNRLLKDGCKHVIQRWLLVLMVILAERPQEELEELAAAWNFSLDYRSRLIFCKEPVHLLKEQLDQTELKNSQIYRLLEPMHSEQLMYLLLTNDSKRVVDRVLEFNRHLRRLEPEVSGKDILDLGFPPGPLFKEAIARVKVAKLDGEVCNRVEEMEFIEAYFKGKEGV